MAIVHFPIKLTARRMIAPSVAHLSFLRDDGQPLPCIPGQFIQIHFHNADGSTAKRSYSIAIGRAPDAAPDAEINMIPALRGSVTEFRGLRVDELAELPEGAWVRSASTTHFPSARRARSTA